MFEEVAEVDTGDDFPVNEREYKFEELSARAKDTARNWFCSGWMDYQWWDTVYDDMEQLGEERGFDVEDIRFSGFWSQGDGASWTGSVLLADCMEWMLAQPEDSPQYRRIGDDRHRWLVFIELIRNGWVERRANVIRDHSMYVHENTVRLGDIDWSELYERLGYAPDERGDDTLISGVLAGASACEVAIGIDVHNLIPDIHKVLADEVRDFCRHIYKTLEEEYDHLTSDEVIAETCEANDVVFDIDGRRI